MYHFAIKYYFKSFFNFRKDQVSYEFNNLRESSTSHTTLNFNSDLV